MNSNTVAALIGGTARNQIPSQTLATVTETLVLVNAVTDAAVTTTSAAMVQVPLQTDILGSSNPMDISANASSLQAGEGRLVMPQFTGRPGFNSDIFNGHPFRVRVAGIGSAAANAGNTLILALYQGTSSTIGSDNKIAANTALATASAATLNFNITADMIWDSTSQSLGGICAGVINYNGTSTSYSNAGSAAMTDVASVAAASSLSFLFSVKWGNAVGGVIAVKEFGIELL